MIAFSLQAAVPFGQLIENGGLTIIASPYPLIPPGVALPGQLPPEMQTYGVMLSASTLDVETTRYLATGVLETEDGGRLAFTEVWARKPNEFSAVLIPSGKHAVVRILRLTILPIREGQEKTFGEIEGFPCSNNTHAICSPGNP